MLAVFNIEKAVDGNGMPITPVAEYTSNIIRQVTSGVAGVNEFLIRFPPRHPKPFKCRITPRSQEAIDAILQTDSFTKSLE